MQDKPLVSFIMGVYNTKNFNELARSIDNMLGQTYPNIEVVICDDCSTNGVYEYLIENYSKNPKIKVVRNEKNSGAGVARNNAILHAKGEYVAVQDDDDYSSLDRIQKQVDFLENNPEFDLVSAGLVKFDEQGEWAKVQLKPYPTKRDFRKSSQHVHACTLFRKSCLEKVNGYRISKETVRGEDYDLFMRIYAKNMKGYNIPETLYYYNISRKGRKRSKYKHRYYESVIRRKGFKAMRLPIFDYIYVLKPLVVGLFPERVRNFIKKIIKRAK